MVNTGVMKVAHGGGIYVFGKHVFIVGSDSLAVLDMSDPRAPNTLCEVNAGVHSWSGDVAVLDNGGVATFDVENPADSKHLFPPTGEGGSLSLVGLVQGAGITKRLVVCWHAHLRARRLLLDHIQRVGSDTNSTVPLLCHNQGRSS